MTDRPQTAPRPCLPAAAGVAPPGGDDTNADGAEPPCSKSTAIGSLSVDVVFDDADWSAFGPVDALVQAAVTAVSNEGELGLEGCEATLALSSDTEVAALNATYRGKSRPTNVLSFPAPPTYKTSPHRVGPRHLGDVIIARETVMAEAADLAIPPAHHLQHLVVHGLLHLLGYDHETDEDATVMEACEVRILSALGVPDPYGAPELGFGEP